MCKDFHVLISPLLYISFLGKECQQGFLFLLIFLVMWKNVPYGIFALCSFTDGYLLISQKSAADKDPIDALSGDFDSCPTPTETSEKTAEKVLCYFNMAFLCVNT